MGDVQPEAKAYVDDRFQEVLRLMEARFDGLSAKLDGVSAKVDAVYQLYSPLLQAVQTLSEKVERILEGSNGRRVTGFSKPKKR